MASSNTTARECATCMQNSDEEKVKPGVALCEGCHQTYCLSHFVEHRQTLNKALDDIAGQRDILRSRLDELAKEAPKEQLKVIDDWKHMMLEMVTEAANNVQQQVHQIIISEMERECIALTSKITSFRVSEDYFEKEIEALQTKIKQLNEELNDISSLHRIQLNLPTLDCTNMVQTKSFEIHPPSETTSNSDSVPLKPKVEYSSFLKRFLTTHQPLSAFETSISGCACASPTILIDVGYSKITRLVFHRLSTSTFERNSCDSILAICWSFWLQQFILLTSRNVLAVDAVEKQVQVVIETQGVKLKYMSSWKHRCLISDEQHRVFLYQANKNLTAWRLLYCWSSPTTCKSSETITAIGLNEQHIVLSLQCGDQYCFSIRKHDMTYCSDIQLTYPCTTIQALPKNEWLLYSSLTDLYYVIDSELKQHDEPYLSSLKDSKINISYYEPGKILVVLLPRISQTASNAKSNIKVYTENC